MEFIRLDVKDEEAVENMSSMAYAIVREHFDPIIGKAQNDYMLEKFQTVSAIRDQLVHGYQYFFVKEGERTIGFLAYYPKHECMYLSKFYLYKEERGKGYSRNMLDFVIQKTREAGLSCIELNVNRNNDAILAYEKLGFVKTREEKNDIGHGFFMDDFVYRLDI